MRRNVLAAAGGVAGLTLGGFLALQGAATGASLGVGFVGGVAGVLTGRYYDRLPDEDAWPVARWSAVFVGVTMIGIFLALDHGGPFDTATTFALQVFVLVTAWNAFVVGAVAAEERRRHAEATPEGDDRGAETSPAGEDHRAETTADADRDTSAA